MKRKKDYRDSLLDNLNAIRDVDDFVKDMDLESLVKKQRKALRNYLLLACHR